MVAPGRGGNQNHTYIQSQANIKQAQLTNAYQELAKELGTERLDVVGGYTLGRVIGEGSYGSVHIATHRLTGTRTAIKKVPKSFTPHLTREIHHHRRLHHPHIVHLHEIVATESNIWLVAELCSGGELFDYLVERGRMQEGEARRIFGELTVAVGSMHREGVVHRDLKLENVLLDGELRVKLADLGFAREWQKGRVMDTHCGTTGYASPEMLACRKYLGVETDIWSLGIILYILLCGGLPFDDDDERVMKELIHKGEYEEPDWMSEEARNLIRGMLRQDPSQRLTIEEILTHPWFKMTLVDKSNPNGETISVPPSPNPTSPPETEGFFDESAIRHHPSRHHLTPHAPLPSPLSIHAPATPREDSETSDASVNDDSDSKGGSGATTPPTTTEEGSPRMSRINSAEFSNTEKELELLHPNNSQTTIRAHRPASSPRSATGSIIRNKVAIRTPLEGQMEEEEGDEGMDDHTSLPLIDEHLHLPVAQNSRTPSRTKRRSVSSTLSLERRLSHHSHHSHHASSSQYITYVPEDYFAKLNELHPPHFSTPSEQHLLHQLAEMGMDIGQLRHSVETDACDSSAGMWWILRGKQAERGETDEVTLQRERAAANKREKAAAWTREERRKAREAEKTKIREREPVIEEEISTLKPKELEDASSDNETQLYGTKQLGVPVDDHDRDRAGPSFTIPLVSRPLEDGQVIEMATFSKSISLGEGSTLPRVVIPMTPPKPYRFSTPEMSPSRDKDRIKVRSPSINMLQRATSALVGNRKAEEKDRVDADEYSPSGREEKRGGSPTKLRKPPPPAVSNLVRSESDGLLSIASRSSPASGSHTAGPCSPSSVVMTHKATPQTVVDDGDVRPIASDGGKGKGGKRDSIWSTFRHLFYEDRRRRKREAASRSPLSTEVKIPPAVMLSRGANSRTPQYKRSNGPSGSRRTSFDGRPLYSRRSSSVNSRRSSLGSLQMTDHAPMITDLGRRPSQRSHGSQTPTSDREYVDYAPSRPGSAHSLGRGGSRRSSLSIRSPSLQSDTSARFKNGPPNSPLHNYRRRAAGGHDSSRVRHIRVIPESQIMRSSSLASSIRSTTSSRASSVDGKRDSEYESGVDDASMRSGRRQKRRTGSQRSLAQQIHRARSPLASHDLGPPKKPIRDVFQNKGKGKGVGSGDEDWVSEEDEFACGLGQGRTLDNPAAAAGGPSAIWMNGSRTAAAFPSARLAPQASMGGRKRETTNRRGSMDDERQDGRRKSGETQSAHGLGVQMEGMGGGRNRRTLPGRPAAPGIIEEEEEDEE